MNEKYSSQQMVQLKELEILTHPWKKKAEEIRTRQLDSISNPGSYMYNFNSSMSSSNIVSSFFPPP